MGVLDDAIKEHLELKRRHGAAEDEVQRQEEEALGPARRDVAQQHEEEGESAVATAAEETALFDGGDAPAAEAPVAEPPESPAPEAEPTVLHEPVAEEPTPVEPPPVEPPPAEPPPAEPPSTADPDVPALSEEPPAAGQPPVGQEPEIGSHAPDEPAVEPGEDDPRDARLGDTQPHGFDALEDEQAEESEEDQDLLVSDPEAEDEDVLEDTPDFLQDTPEHDRLWFEQKPPRDFDFD